MMQSVGIGGIDASRPDLVLGSGARHWPLARWLLGPFIDLEPCKHGPLCARGVEHYWLPLADAHRPRLVLQRIFPRPFRNLRLSEAGLRGERGDDRRQLTPARRSARR